MIDLLEIEPHALIHQAIRAALQAANPTAAVERALFMRDDNIKVHTPIANENTDEGKTELVATIAATTRILAVGAGKAGVGMADGLQRALASIGREASGWVTVKEGFSGGHSRIGGIQIAEAAHPLPDSRTLVATERIIAIARSAQADDLLFVLISGGGSALLEQPAAGLTLDDIHATTRTLMHAGADIAQLNTVRKHLSAVKGGRLAQLAYPATVLTLIISDVIGDDPALIASGPTVADHSTAAAALAVIDKLDATHRLPPAVLHHLQVESKRAIPPADNSFAHCHSFIVASNTAAVAASQRQLLTQLPLVGGHSIGYDPHPAIALYGEARDAATTLVDHLCEHLDEPQTLLPAVSFVANPTTTASGWAIVLGGETSVTVHGSGRGGRNQEFALAAAIALDAQREQLTTHRITIAACASDGDDGYGGASGAIADQDTVTHARAVGLEPATYLLSNDSHSFWQALGERYPNLPSPHIVTGPSGTNVNDICICIVQPR